MNSLDVHVAAAAGALPSDRILAAAAAAAGVVVGAGDNSVVSGGCHWYPAEDIPNHCPVLLRAAQSRAQPHQHHN